MDIFATLCAFDPSGNEMTFRTGGEPKAPAKSGLAARAVPQRKLYPKRSTRGTFKTA